MTSCIHNINYTNEARGGVVSDGNIESTSSLGEERQHFDRKTREPGDSQLVDFL